MKPQIFYSSRSCNGSDFVDNRAREGASCGAALAEVAEMRRITSEAWHTSRRRDVFDGALGRRVDRGGRDRLRGASGDLGSQSMDCTVCRSISALGGMEAVAEGCMRIRSSRSATAGVSARNAVLAVTPPHSATSSTPPHHRRTPKRRCSSPSKEFDRSCTRGRNSETSHTHHAKSVHMSCGSTAGSCGHVAGR
ncbi:hypothetical protein GEV33_006975 [Tenebrio molitor]|uniref:Uncharacterized protein n=1 Tax=Tenebrio molitor TaxID=7067 RepID=A0A8J6HKR1_TENMO|nr:hypothetical protein GEV33_006975 [Tenebrio molitor]